jgi:hypothetical protein
MNNITKDEALKLALEALENELNVDITEAAEVGEAAELMCDAITAIKQALAAPVHPVERIESINDTDSAYAYADGWNACVEHHKYIAKNAPAKDQP